MDRYDELLRTQISLEEESRELSLARMRRQAEMAAGRGEAENTAQAKLILAGVMEPLTEGLEKRFEALSEMGRGRRATCLKPLMDCPLDAEEIAYLSFRTCLSVMMAGGQVDKGGISWAQLAGLIANRLIDEILLRQLSDTDKGLLKRWKDELSERGLTRPRAQEMIRKQVSGLEMDWTYTDPSGLEWDRDVQMKIGKVLIELVIESTGVLVGKKRYKEGSKQRQEYLEPTERFYDLVEKAGQFIAEAIPVYLPTVVPPVQWDTDNLVAGGYFTKNIRPYPIIKRAKREWLDDFAETSHNTVAAINAIQDTPWRVNKEILEAVEFIYLRGQGEAKLPLKDRLELPEAPEEFSMEYRREAYRIHEINRKQLGKRLQYLTAVDIAKKFSEYDAIYFPHDCDSRGRIYPKPVSLNPQGPGYVKAMLEFADGKPLGSEQAAAWLAIHVANTYGKDKLKLQERIDWTLDNSELIVKVASEWKRDDRWLQADSPFEFLAAAISWKGYIEEGLDYHCRTPIAVDATCSGLQHYSAMLRDEVGGRSVNLCADEQRQDVYQEVADRAKANLEASLNGPSDQLARALLDFGLGRSDVKRQVMTVPYAATFSSCYKYTAEAIRERISNGEEISWDGDIKEIIKFAAETVWQAISEVVIAATEAMRWIKTAARQYAKESGMPYLQWMAPSGFLARINKFDKVDCMVDTVLDGKRMRMRYVKHGANLCPSSMSTSTPPSFVHSLDAAHLVLTMEEASRMGVTHLGVVHDSFSAHAADMELLNETIRVKFHEIYTECDPLSLLKEAFEEGCEESLPELPKKGSLDIDEVLQSTFFFS